MRFPLVRMMVVVAAAAAALILLAGAVAGVRSARAASGDVSSISQAAYAETEPEQLVAVSQRLSPITVRRMITDPGLNTPATISVSGRKIVVTGHVSCIKGDEYRIETSITQSSTAALAKGETSGICTGKTEQFSATVWAYDEALFVPGPAQACALATIRTKDKLSDVFQWCRKEDVKLVAAAAGSY